MGRNLWLLFGLSLTVSAQAAPASCIGSVCLNATVIDSYNRIGTVISIRRSDVLYNVSGTIYTTSASSLSAAVQSSNGIASGMIVIDNYNRVGSAIAVFGNGKVQYNVSGTHYVSSSVTASVPSYRGISRSTIVIDNYNRIGRTILVFEDGRAQYSVSGTSYVASGSNLSPEINEHPKYSKDRIYADELHRVGRPSLFFRDGRIAFSELTGSSRIARQLHEEVNQLEGYTMGIAVNDPWGPIGKVLNVFENGALYIEYDFADEKGQPMRVKTSAKIYGINPKQIEHDQQNWLNAIASMLRQEPGRTIFPSGGLAIRADALEHLKADLALALQKKPELIYNPSDRAEVAKYLGGPAAPTPVPVVVTKPNSNGSTTTVVQTKKTPRPVIVVKPGRRGD